MNGIRTRVGRGRVFAALSVAAALLNLGNLDETQTRRKAALQNSQVARPKSGARNVPTATVVAAERSPAAPVLRETTSAELSKPKLLDRVRHAVRARHYSRRTEKAYVHWIKRYIFFHGKRHPAEMGAAELTAFLTALAVRERVAASTQNQALNALLFLYREILGIELPWLDELVRAKRPQHLPTVLTRDEVGALLERLDGVPA